MKDWGRKPAKLLNEKPLNLVGDERKKPNDWLTNCQWESLMKNLPTW